MINLCTLFDSYYLDKGIAMYRSLENVSDDFNLYIFCFDDKSFEVLNALQLKHAVMIHHSKIETEELLKLKGERSKPEYCWTCTPVVIEYVLNNYPVDSCTYIDSDLYFFSDPQVLFDEIKQDTANIIITEHRFSSSRKDQRLLKRSGKYCVEFNYFDQSENAREALNWWKEKCFEWCFHIYEPERMGDQKYIEKFPKLFKGVHELQHLGGGVAPWNLHQYELKRANGLEVILRKKDDGMEFPLIFYHFQNIRYLSENWVNVSSEVPSKKLKDAIYCPYLKSIEDIRKELRNYGVTFGVKNVHSSNPLIAFLQGGILRYRIHSITDVYDLRKFR